MRTRGRWVMKDEVLVAVPRPEPEPTKPEPRWPEPERKDLYCGNYL